MRKVQFRSELLLRLYSGDTTTSKPQDLFSRNLISLPFEVSYWEIRCFGIRKVLAEKGRHNGELCGPFCFPNIIVAVFNEERHRGDDIGYDKCNNMSPIGNGIKQIQMTKELVRYWDPIGFKVNAIPFSFITVDLGLKKK